MEEKGELNLLVPVPFTSGTPLFSQSLCCLYCKMFRNVTKFSLFLLRSRNLGNQASALFSLFTTIQVVDGIYGEGPKHFQTKPGGLWKDDKWSLGRGRREGEGSIEGFKPSLASLLFGSRPYQDTESIHFVR